MQTRPLTRVQDGLRLRASVTATALLLGVAFGMSGCTVGLAPLARHTAAFSAATATIVEGSVDAYRSAQRLDQQERIAEAAAAYNNDPSWNPYHALRSPLLTPEQMSARIKVLQGLKLYAELLAHLTDGKRQYKGLGAAATSAGNNLETLSASATPDLQTLFPSLTAMTDTEAKGTGIALNLVGRLLIDDKVSKGLKITTQEMNPSVEALCRLMASDVKIVRREADRDYQTLLTNDNQFIQKNTIDPVLRRLEVANLLDLAARQQTSEAKLDRLQKALVSLELTHQALAAAAQNNNPETVKQHIVDLVTLGQELGTP